MNSKLNYGDVLRTAYNKAGEFWNDNLELAQDKAVVPFGGTCECFKAMAMPVVYLSEMGKGSLIFLKNQIFNSKQDLEGNL